MADIGSRQGWLYAVRLAGAEGWQWEASLLDLSAYRLALDEAGVVVDDVVEIQAYRRSTDLPDPPGRFRFVTRRWRGWAYDVAALCWRAPDEPLTVPFPGVPAPVPSLDIAFSLPEAGWLPVTITAGGRTATFDASDVYDPFPDLLLWLERLADGRFPRLCIDGEDIFIEFHVFPHRGESVRFAVTIDMTAIGEPPPVLEIDVVIDRRVLLSSIYRPFIAFWESQALADNADEWRFAAGEEDHYAEDNRPYSLRSRLIDSILAEGP